MRFYDHRHMNGTDVRRILARERRRVGRRPWQTALELLSLVAAIAAIVALLGVMQ
jgi:hypothetical protein